MASDEENTQEILKIKENKFYYTPSDYIHISNTNFLPTHFGFSSGRPRYLKIKVNNFNIANENTEKVKEIEKMVKEHNSSVKPVKDQLAERVN